MRRKQLKNMFGHNFELDLVNPAGLVKFRPRTWHRDIPPNLENKMMYKFMKNLEYALLELLNV